MSTVQFDISGKQRSILGQIIYLDYMRHAGFVNPVQKTLRLGEVGEGKKGEASR